MSSRLMYVRMEIGKSKYVIVGVYGLKSEKKKDDSGSLWYDLGELVVVLRAMR